VLYCSYFNDLSIAVMTQCVKISSTYKQGWARDVKAQDRDEYETLTSRDEDETKTSASLAETRRL